MMIEMRSFMKNLLLLLIIGQLNLGCNSNDLKSEQKVSNFDTFKVNEKVDTLIHLDSKKSEVTNTCECEQGKYIQSYSTDLVFQDSDIAKIKNDTLFAKWSQAELVDQIKSIRFVNYDTIPKKFSIFKEVNRLSIQSRNGLYGLDIFPQLHTVHFFGSVIDLDTNEKWLNGIEAIYGQKTKFLGLESFTEITNLRIMSLGYSGFEEFPNDFDQLDCLYQCTLGSYTYGKINLNELDLSKNKCLQEVEFQTWNNTLHGIPNGILESKIKKIKVSHQKLTELEKEKLEKIKASL